MKPRLSVLLPVYNGEKYFRKSIESILNQTFKDFELLVLNDGSSDDSLQIVKGIHDDRIKIVSHENMGLGATLKRGLELAEGELVARQDADDISLPNRFAKQIDFLKKNKDVALVGTWAQIMDDNGNLQPRYHKHPSKGNELRFDLVFNNPFVHSSVMFRRHEIQEVGGYSEERNAIEDYDLWSRVSHEFSVANLAEVLLHYREVSTGISQSNPYYKAWVMRIMGNNVRYFLPELSNEEVEKITRVYHGESRIGDFCSDAFITELINQLVQIVLPDITKDEQLEYSGKHIFQMKRKYYNSILERRDTRVFQKIKFLMKRKMLFESTPKNFSK